MSPSKVIRGLIIVLACIVGSFFLVQLLYVLPVRTRTVQECLICRNKFEESRFILWQRTYGIRSSIIADELFGPSSAHVHTNITRAVTRYNVLGELVGTANFRLHPIVTLDPEQEYSLLTNCLGQQDLSTACQLLTSEDVARRFVAFASETNCGCSNVQLLFLKK
jgi:hypothetical protein